jgi:hypothetical protein
VKVKNKEEEEEEEVEEVEETDTSHEFRHTTDDVDQELLRGYTS